MWHGIWLSGSFALPEIQSGDKFPHSKTSCLYVAARQCGSTEPKKPRSGRRSEVLRYGYDASGVSELSGSTDP